VDFVGGLVGMIFSLLGVFFRKRFIKSLRRGNYRALRKFSGPVLRNYSYKGFKVTHDIRNKSQWNAYILGEHQPGVAHWLATFASPDATSLDIGANVGVFALELLVSSRPHGIVHAFEPNPEAVALLEKTIADNSLQENLKVHGFALGEEERLAELKIPDKNNGAASMRPVESANHVVQVQVRQFLNWWKEWGCPKIDVIKIDVEGLEYEVVDTLKPVLDRDKPGIVMELSPRKYDASSLVEKIIGMGYEVFQVTEDPPYWKNLPEIYEEQLDIVCGGHGCFG
jgi:FkbM family methyltransferase